MYIYIYICFYICIYIYIYIYIYIHTGGRALRGHAARRRLRAPVPAPAPEDGGPDIEVVMTRQLAEFNKYAENP